jgi:hypothetical protein
MKRSTPLAASLVAAAIAGAVWAGHEFPIYPSFYPHEIRIAAMTPDEAGAGLAANKVHAYLGPPPFSAAIPESVKPIDTLGALVVVRVNPQRDADRGAACALAHATVREMAQRAGSDGVVRIHPYPVTPYDGDYLYYADRADAARARILGDAGGKAERVRVRVDDARLRDLVPASWRGEGTDWDVAIDAIDAAALTMPARHATNGWTGPPWLHAAWLRTVLLLGPQTGDAGADARIASLRARLEAGDYTGTAERVTLARALVDALAANCRAVVAGYTLRHEYVNDDYSAGIENIGYDSLAGLASPLFLRTVKLKDFPWNGWLSIGLDAQPKAAWNPIGGFTDRFGQLTWSALGDPAFLPQPGGAGWMLNRVSDVR